jgi:hypothetical protein
MHTFKRRRDHQGLSAVNPEQPRGLDNQKGTHALAPTQGRVAHCINKSAGSQVLSRTGLRRQEAVQKAFSTGRNGVQAPLETGIRLSRPSPTFVERSLEEAL